MISVSSPPITSQAKTFVNVMGRPSSKVLQWSLPWLHTQDIVLSNIGGQCGSGAILLLANHHEVPTTMVCVQGPITAEEMAARLLLSTPRVRSRFLQFNEKEYFKICLPTISLTPGLHLWHSRYLPHPPLSPDVVKPENAHGPGTAQPWS